MAIILIENFRAVFYTPFYAAFALGAFESEGVAVRRVASERPADTMQALLSGKGDVAWGGPIRLLSAYNHDPTCELVIFCEVVGRDPFFLVGREPLETFRFDDLLGTRLATVSEVPTPWLCLQHDLRLAGLDPARLDRVTDRTMPENVEALRAGEVDVIQAFQPYVEHALADGAGHVWYAAANRGPTAYTSLYTTRDFVARDPEGLLRMTRAMFRTLAWIGRHDAAELADRVADYFPDLPRHTLSRALARYRALGLWNRTPVLDAGGLAWLAAACRTGGFIAHEVPYDRCADMQFANRVVRETSPG